MRGTFVDIENEPTDIGNEVDILFGGVAIFQRNSADADPAWSWLAIQGLASGVEKIYTGCERIMAMIAGDVDGARNLQGAGSTTLLQAPRTEHLRIGLDAAIVVERAQTKLAFEQFKSELAAFIGSKNAAEPSEQNSDQAPSD
jgi:hypothetical protein